MVYHSAYTYQGVIVQQSKNWLLGSGEGIAGNSPYKMDFGTDSMGGFFKKAVDVIDAPEPVNKRQLKQKDVGLVPVSVEESKGSAVSEMCTSKKDEDYKISEWIVYFDTNKASPKNIDKLLSEIKETHPTAVTISGHTDNVGSDIYNLALSKKRALTVKNMISPTLTGVSYEIRWGGPCPRAALNINSKNRALNRRVVITAYNTPLNSVASYQQQAMAFKK